ncbi:MAG: peptidoglycan DD-metalloendopeptidase family protein [Beijerinckiaceae bacterium]|nr:peptidoglycan DD-metalloendopeptidase family protein [Beijerinckiaceae bacterium]
MISIRTMLILGTILVWPIASTFSLAQTKAPTVSPSSPISAADAASRKLELDETERLLATGAEDRAKLAAEIETLRSDRSRLSQRMIETADRIKATELRIGSVEERLATLKDSEAKARASLESRRAVVIDVLAALQRVGATPPPLLFADPDSILDTVRSSILLGSVVPELKGETDALMADLSAIERIRQTAGAEREALARDVSSLVRDRQDIELLVSARQKDIAGAESKANEQAAQAASLAAKSQTLKDLIGRVEGEVDSVSKAARDANSASAKNEEDAKSANDPAAKDARNRFAALAFRDPSRLAPKVSFGELKGLLPQPVNGTLVNGFNKRDTVGGVTKGISIATRPNAIVSSPSDGWVSYSGPFRSYGQLLILNAGGGYYILLAGMDRISVSLGQFVLAGEPVATMGDPQKDTSGQPSSDKRVPTLYIEFRKDGTPIDPQPWWASGSNEKVRG